MPSNKPKRKRTAVEAGRETEWYRCAFSEDYLWLYAHRSEKEAVDQVRVAIAHVPYRRGQKILDIACGSGRHMLAFAKRGAIVTGVDLSGTLVREARKRFVSQKVRAVIKEGDMRELPYRDTFDGATIWFTSIGYFRTIAEDQRVITGMAEALKPGGWWWVDLPNPAFLMDSLVPHSQKSTRSPNGWAMVEERRKIVRGRVEKVILIDDPAGKRKYKESVRLYRPEQFGNLIKQANLATDGILGDYDGSPLTRQSPRQIWFGRKSSF